MNPNRRRRVLAAAIAAASMIAAPAIAADAFPSKAITLVVPFAPGGTTDIVARVVAQKLSAELGQSVIIDNRAGAGGTLGAAYVAKASPDGYTVFLSTIAHSIAPAIYKTLSYDFQKDFDPVGLVATVPNVLIVNPSLPVKDVAELIAYIKAHPGEVNYGSAGIGSTEHMSGELFRSMTGTSITHVPYKGGAPMMNDLMGGQIQMAIETSPSAEPQVKGGKVKALAVSTAKRQAVYPGVPTLDEAGVKGYDTSTWYALMAPHGTPPAVEAKLADALAKALKDPEILKRFEEQGVIAGNMTPSQLGTFIASETVKWGKVAKAANIQAE